MVLLVLRPGSYTIPQYIIVRARELMGQASYFKVRKIKRKSGVEMTHASVLQ